MGPKRLSGAQDPQLDLGQVVARKEDMKVKKKRLVPYVS